MVLYLRDIRVSKPPALPSINNTPPGRATPLSSADATKALAAPNPPYLGSNRLGELILEPKFETLWPRGRVEETPTGMIS
jgi:hypothetical protein